MEWVETTAKTIDEAKDRALDQLGVAADEAEFEVLEEPKSGLFGRVRGEARVRARVRPTAVRPKQDRRNRARGKSKRDGNDGAKRSPQGDATSPPESAAVEQEAADTTNSNEESGPRRDSAKSGKQPGRQRSKSNTSKQTENKVSDDQANETPSVSPQEVGDAAVTFMSGLADAFGAEASTTLDIDGTDLDVRLAGDELGLMVGPGGRTLTAVQDLARVASQRRLGDHDTRLRIDVAGYRERRRVALEKFTRTVADQVLDSGSAKALEPMSSADRKVVHDTVVGIDGVTSSSQGDDPGRRVVITPE